MEEWNSGMDFELKSFVSIRVHSWFKFFHYFAQISPSPKLNQRVVVVLRWV